VTARRPVPGMQAKCRTCQAAIVFAVTVASERGPGGKWQPFDPLEDPKGNVAVRAINPRRSHARALGKDDMIDRETEVRAMPHAATCQPALVDKPEPPAPTNVLDLAVARAKRGRR